MFYPASVCLPVCLSVNKIVDVDSVGLLECTFDKFWMRRNVKYDNKLCGRPSQYAPAPCKLIFDLLTFTVVSESRVTCATFVPILVFLGLCVLDLGPMYATDRPVFENTYFMFFFRFQKKHDFLRFF